LFILQEALDAANKVTEELQEQLQQVKKAAADEAHKAAEVHAVQIQKMVVERTKLEVRAAYCMLALTVWISCNPKHCCASHTFRC
jgi:predicted phage tail protein